MNIPDLVDQVNKIADNHSRDVEAYCQDTNIPLEERWNLFTQAEIFLGVDYSMPYHLLTDTLPTISEHNTPFNTGHYNYLDVLCILMDWAMDDTDPRVADHIESEEELENQIKEAILENGYFSIVIY